MVHKSKLERYIDSKNIPKTDLIWAHYALDSKKNPTKEDIRIKGKIARRLKTEFDM